MPAARPMSSSPRLSVVLAVDRASEALRATLRRWSAEDAAATEQLVVVLADAGDEALVRELAPRAEILCGPRNALIPELWGLGIAAAAAPWVALTIGDCVPDGAWRRRLGEVTETAPESVAGLGGPILPPVAGGGREWALYLLRYSAYLAVPSGPAVEIPGDNAVYRRSELERHWRDRSAGFWEVQLHDELRRAGRELRFDAGLRVRLVRTPPTLRAAATRFRHGLRFGATRSLSALRRLAAGFSAPVLVLVLLARVRRRVRTARPEWQSRLRLAMPWLVVFVVAWSLGETLGYLAPRAGRRA